MITTNDLSLLNSKNVFLSYKGTKDKNILFIGSCRITPLMFYFNQVFPEHNLFGIYVPCWTDTSSLSKDVVQKILYSTDFLITETVRNFNILNTDKDKENNFFETFDVKASEIRIANLELRMYAYDLINTFNIPPEESLEYFEKSKIRLKSSLEVKDQKFIWNFIINNFKSLKLFATHNHPTRILSILSFISIVKTFGLDLNFEFVEKICKYDFLEGNSTPITQMDIDRYGFEFKTKVFENNTVGSFYQPTDEEKTVSNVALEKILAAYGEIC
jgi:hypothetical protein